MDHLQDLRKKPEVVIPAQAGKANLKCHKAAVEGRLVETEAELARRVGRDYEIRRPTPGTHLG